MFSHSQWAGATDIILLAGTGTIIMEGELYVVLLNEAGYSCYQRPVSSTTMDFGSWASKYLSPSEP